MYSSSQLLIVILVTVENYCGIPSSTNIWVYLMGASAYIINPLLLIYKHFAAEKHGWYFKTAQNRHKTQWNSDVSPQSASTFWSVQAHSLCFSGPKVSCCSLWRAIKYGVPTLPWGKSKMMDTSNLTWGKEWRASRQRYFDSWFGISNPFGFRFIASRVHLIGLGQKPPRDTAFGY